MIENNRLKEFLLNSPKEISINYSELNFSDVDGFNEFQAGYRYNYTTNEDLTSDKRGDWQKDWFVIGYFAGDPFFVDLGDNQLPIYTAYHGQGEWKPILVAKSIEDFQKIIDKIKELSKGREYPVKFENNPINERELKDLQDILRQTDSKPFLWMKMIE